jgi:hypothetical protein
MHGLRIDLHPHPFQLENDNSPNKKMHPSNNQKGALLCLNVDNTQFLRAIGNDIVKDMGVL